MTQACTEHVTVYLSEPSRDPDSTVPLTDMETKHAETDLPKVTQTWVTPESGTLREIWF